MHKSQCSDRKTESQPKKMILTRSVVEDTLRIHDVTDAANVNFQKDTLLNNSNQ